MKPPPPLRDSLLRARPELAHVLDAASVAASHDAPELTLYRDGSKVHVAREAGGTLVLRNDCTAIRFHASELPQLAAFLVALVGAQ